MTVKIGLDNGNYALKLWKNGDNETPISIPTVVSLYTGETNDLLEQEDIPKKELANNIDVTINSKTLNQNGLRFIVGNKVLEDDLEAEELEKNSDKSTDEITAIMGLSGLTVKAISENYHNDNIEVSCDISLSLPVNTITAEKAEQYAERFIGTHEIIYHHPSGRDQKVTIKIDYARTLPEGSAGAWGIIYNEDGSLKKWEIKDQTSKETLEEATLLHYDIGAGTTEEVVTEGVVYKPKQSYGYGYGVKSTIEDIRKRWNYKRQPNEMIDSVAEFNKIFFDKENARHDELIKLSELPLRQLAKKFAKIIINKIDDMKTKPIVFIYGGGSIILESYLRDELKAKGRMNRVIFLNDPINVTAKGLLVYTCSPRYEQKKEEDLGVTSDGEKTK